MEETISNTSALTACRIGVQLHNFIARHHPRVMVVHWVNILGRTDYRGMVQLKNFGACENLKNEQLPKKDISHGIYDK